MRNTRARRQDVLEALPGGRDDGTAQDLRRRRLQLLQAVAQRGGLVTLAVLPGVLVYAALASWWRWEAGALGLAAWLLWDDRRDDTKPGTPAPGGEAIT